MRRSGPLKTLVPVPPPRFFGGRSTVFLIRQGLWLGEATYTAFGKVISITRLLDQMAVSGGNDYVDTIKRGTVVGFVGNTGILVDGGRSLGASPKPSFRRPLNRQFPGKP